MKIAITADPELPVPPVFYGGIERIIYMLIVELLKAGHDVTLFAHRDSQVPCKLIAYPCSGNNLKDIVLNSLTISKALLLKKFDIIHSFGRLAYLLPLMPSRISKLMSYQREPTISQIKRAVKLSNRGTLSFNGCSNYITDKIKPFAPAFTVYNGVDMDKYTTTARVADDAPLIFLGRIEPIKGPHTAIDIALKTGKKLVIAGNIPAEYQVYFDEQIKPRLSDQIEYIGPVNDEQKNSLLQKGLALLMPIHWDEPFGIVMIEAMACGTPVIGFNRGAVPEVIDCGLTGFYNDGIEELEEKVKEVHLLDRLKIRQKAEERFSAKVITDEYLSVYRRFANNK